MAHQTKIIFVVETILESLFRGRDIRDDMFLGNGHAAAYT